MIHPSNQHNQGCPILPRPLRKNGRIKPSSSTSLERTTASAVPFLCRGETLGVYLPTPRKAVKSADHSELKQLRRSRKNATR